MYSKRKVYRFGFMREKKKELDETITMLSYTDKLAILLVGPLNWDILLCRIGLAIVGHNRGLDFVNAKTK